RRRRFLEQGPRPLRPAGRLRRRPLPDARRQARRAAAHGPARRPSQPHPPRHRERRRRRRGRAPRDSRLPASREGPQLVGHARADRTEVLHRPAAARPARRRSQRLALAAVSFPRLAFLIFIQMLPATLLTPAIRPLFASVHGGAEGAMQAFMSVNMIGAALAAPFVGWVADRGVRRGPLLAKLAAADG